MLATLRSASAATCFLALLPALASAAAATTTTAAASSSTLLSAMTYKGCFNSSTPLINEGSYTYQTSGYCQPICVDKGYAVLGLTGGSYCYCGAELPAAASLVDDSNCNTPCSGYGDDDCGGTGYWSVYLTGDETEVGNYVSSSSTTAATTTTAAATTEAATTSAVSVITSVVSAKTVVVTASATAAASTSNSASDSSKDEHKSSSTNAAGIAAGVVVGIVAFAALVLGAWLLMRRRRRRQAEEEYSKRAQAQSYITPSPTGTVATRGLSVRSHGNDSRLDPEAMMQRRQSDGSIADNEDYSRRILQVTNPDGT